jgi:translation initiation factor 3 subunit E
LKTTDFGRKRENAISTNERLHQEAQAVLDVIENPDVAQALWQDKNQNLQYLKNDYHVSFVYAFSAF